MSDDWDVYFTHVDEKPASILLDLALAADAPIPAMTVMAYVTIAFRDPDENGMSKQSEDSKLMELEDALIPALTGETCIFVGRCTTGGHRDFFFYMDNAKGFEDRTESIMDRFADYDWDMGLVEEPGWDTYLEFLFPDEQGMDTIFNNRVRRNLESQGDILREPRIIDHWVQFSSLEDLEAFRPEAEQEGFTVSVADSDPEKPFIGALVQRKDAPDDIDDVTWPLRELAGAHGGTYGGWECPVQKGNE